MVSVISIRFELGNSWYVVDQQPDLMVATLKLCGSSDSVNLFDFIHRLSHLAPTLGSRGTVAQLLHASRIIALILGVESNRPTSVRLKNPGRSNGSLL